MERHYQKEVSLHGFLSYGDLLIQVLTSTLRSNILSRLGLVEPSGTLDVHLHVVPHDTGLQAVSGVRITDSLLKRTYEFDDLCQVYVCHPKALIKSIAKVSL